MHIRHLISAVACVFATFALSLAAHASTFTFSDDYVAFPGYPVETPEGPKDEYGYPEINTMTVVVDDARRLLKSVTFNLRSSTIISWDNLFINTSYVNLNGITDKSWDQSWEYFVHSGGSDTKWGRGNEYEVSGSVWTTDGLYAVNPGFNIVDGYTTTKYTRSDSTGNHPNGIDSKFVGQKISDITGVYINNTITYEFSSLTLGGISIGDGFTIGYTPWCANDVFLASAAVPTPEPATMLLFGSGIVGLAGLALRRRKK